MWTNAAAGSINIRERLGSRQAQFIVKFQRSNSIRIKNKNAEHFLAEYHRDDGANCELSIRDPVRSQNN